jgi:phosphoglycolate phosphatase-like HAD superfamily hydrolase
MMRTVSGFHSVVCVGDVLWDAKTCRNLQLPFIGIGRDHKAELLRNEGACSVLADFQDFAAFELALLGARSASGSTLHA